ncbi:MAG: DUF4214 domain-containing protein [Acidobacteriota bacterium]
MALPFNTEAQECCQAWDRPYLCTLEGSVSRPGQRGKPLQPGEEVQVPAGETAELRFRGSDQTGQPFPEDRLTVEVDLDDRCGDRVRIDRPRPDRLHVTAGTERGECRAVVWVPGNLNLEWPVRFEVVGVARKGYTRNQAEFIARRVYLALLAREPDPGGFSGAVAQIQKGKLDSFVEGAARSPEFVEVRGGASPATLLEEFYKGALGRAPDTAGVRRYLPEMTKRRHAAVLLALLRSEEFDAILLREAGR